MVKKIFMFIIYIYIYRFNSHQSNNDPSKQKGKLWALINWKVSLTYVLNMLGNHLKKKTFLLKNKKMINFFTIFSNLNKMFLKMDG